MDSIGQEIAETSEAPLERPKGSKSAVIADKGIESSRDFRNLMSSLMSDVIGGALTPEVTNAACNAGGKLLKMVELEYKYATKPNRAMRSIPVAFDTDEVVVEEASA